MSCEGSSPITSRCPGSRVRHESSHPIPLCLLRALPERASSSVSILLPRGLDILPSAWKANSPKFVFGTSHLACHLAYMLRPDPALRYAHRQAGRPLYLSPPKSTARLLPLSCRRSWVIPNFAPTGF